jgi:hypothetical protein
VWRSRKIDKPRQDQDCRRGEQHPEGELRMSTSVMLLMASFVLSLLGLFVFIEEGSRVIFAPDEENTSEDPAATRTDQQR